MKITYVPKEEITQTEGREVIIPHLPLRLDKATGSDVPTVDLNKAEQYGELISISKGSLWPGDHEELESALDAIPEDSLVMCIGDIIPLHLTISHLLWKYGHCTLMRFERQYKDYRFQRIEA